MVGSSGAELQYSEQPQTTISVDFTYLVIYRIVSYRVVALHIDFISRLTTARLY